jgi:TRAP-type transport system periplasmic protein
MTKKRILSGIIIGSLLLLMLAACGGGSGNSKPTADNPIVLKGVTAWEKNAPNSTGFFMLQEKVKELSDGRLIIEYQGGPEAIPPDQHTDAIRNGVVDIVDTSASYYSPVIPEALAINYSTVPVEEEWDSGAMDYMNKLHNEKLNAQILGRSIEGSYQFYTGKPVESTEDLGNLTLRGTPTYKPLIDALGAEYVEIEPGEIYQALERGVVDGYGWPDHGMTDLGLQEITACRVLPSFWRVDDVNLMNLDTWNDLPPDLQKVMTKASREVEAELPQRMDQLREEEEKTMINAGVKTCKLTDGEKLTQLANESGWQEVKDAVPANEYQKLEKLFHK